MPEEERPEIIREKIKQRPVNRKKLLQRTFLTIALAIVFGVVALMTFLLLEPAFNRLVNPEPALDVNHVTLHETDETEEVPPEELIADDSLIPRTPDNDDIGALLDDYTFDAADYAEMFVSLKSVATEAQKSLVVVTSITRSAAWAGGAFETDEISSGLVVADNGSFLLILTADAEIADAEEIRVRFFEGSVAEASVLASDAFSGLCILQVAHSTLDEAKRALIPIAALGSSSSPVIVGQPVLALGAPTGSYGSMVFGMITSAGRTYRVPDAGYALLSTDIAAGRTSNGFLFNLRGEVIGFFLPYLTAQSVSLDDVPAMLNAYGISGIRRLVEALSNDTPHGYLGVYGEEVPSDVRARENIPQGVYISRIELNSPAMLSGIQSGDILIRIGETDLLSLSALSNALLELPPGTEVEVTLLRMGPEGYTEIVLPLTLG